MKSTYRLLSVFLDGKALPGKEPAIMDATEYDETDDIRSERTLLDYPVCVRKTSAMFLLGQQNFNQVEMMIERIDCRMMLVVLLDYYAGCDVANQLFIKRTLQMIEMITKRFPQASVVLASSVSELIYYRILISEVLKENKSA